MVHADTEFALRLKKLVRDTIAQDGWEEKKSLKNGTKIYTKPHPESAFPIILSKATLNTTPQGLWEFIVENRKECMAVTDPTILEDKLLKQEENGEKVSYMRYKAPFPVSKREFINRHFAGQDEVGFYELYEGVDDEAVPVCKGHVRGMVSFSGMMWQENENGTCDVAYVVSVDPKGSLPTALVNMTSTNQGMNISRMADHFAKQK
eukprot:GCRY01000539.1.p1 GENE.GCRY01000539.1~~GCRY01000539.1.p1  ORF type:complete len:206 (+),score=34.12 GCRY01000539.1:191-808(+)